MKGGCNVAVIRSTLECPPLGRRFDTNMAAILRTTALIDSESMQRESLLQDAA
jgi:hypothetical protein